MAATQYALYQQNGAASVAAAFPQTGTAQNLDLLHIRASRGGDALLAKVDYQGNVIGGTQAGLALTSVSVTSFAATDVTAATGTITGTFTGADANAWAGKKVAVLGFSNSGNNGTFTVVTSTSSAITVTPDAGMMDESGASATVSVYGVSTAVYHGTISNVPSVGTAITVTGFTNAVNNVTAAPITAANGTTITVLFAGQIAETHAASSTITVSGTKGTRIGVFSTSLSIGATVAQLFANAFLNATNQDIIQVVNQGGNVSYYLDYQGVAHGS